MISTLLVLFAVGVYVGLPPAWLPLFHVPEIE